MAMLSNSDLTEESWYKHIPEFELEGLWYINILDGDRNSIKYDDYFSSNSRVDYYVQDVSFPQLNLNYDTTDLGMIYFKDKTPYDEVTVTIYDDLSGSFKGFINDWLHSIYDEKKKCVKRNWRYEAKDLIVTNYRLINDKIQNTTEYSILRCLPKGLSDISVNEESSNGRKSYSFRLVCQKVETKTDKTRLK